MAGPLTLTALDTAHEAPDAETIARVLRSLDRGRVSLATLGRSEQEYVQVQRGAAGGFTLEYQEGSIERRYRSREGALSLEQATQVFQRYAESDPRWREGVAWEAERIEAPSSHWTGTWFGFSLLVLVMAVLFWLWRGW